MMHRRIMLGRIAAGFGLLLVPAGALPALAQPRPYDGGPPGAPDRLPPGAPPHHPPMAGPRPHHHRPPPPPPPPRHHRRRRRYHRHPPPPRPF
ncbi:hypothetical protein NON00_21850 [Roseomonas sp. GC11]|uniref:hypothetical protein n=1 Tax=Roseomonas sp. GC11 TaxID=2950546 RepID=UPI00210A5834|nr:hypothetical protein [Roseomonas sp. GC11]MCQ4162557.1 hypothetical protein [Roseomonas sp. GC11]